VFLVHSSDFFLVGEFNALQVAQSITHGIDPVGLPGSCVPGGELFDARFYSLRLHSHRLVYHSAHVVRGPCPLVFFSVSAVVSVF
jgi:hypothetical protein